MEISKETKTKLIEFLREERDRIDRDITILTNGGIGVRQKKVNPIMKKGTFKTNILSMLEQGKMANTSRELLEMYEHGTGKKQKMPAFSSQLSTLVKGGHIKVHKEPDFPIESRYNYGLPQWFEGEKLKPEYKRAKPEDYL